MSKPDWAVFTEDLDRPPLSLEERANEISDILESGNASELFIKHLAEMIRPNGKHSDLALRLEYNRSHEPKRLAWRVGEEMVRLVDECGENIEVAYREVQKKYGEKSCSRSNCLKALKEARKLARAWQDFED